MFTYWSFQGSLIGVIGKVGAGKSSLLSALMAEMHRLSGHVMVRNLSTGFSLVAQESWIQHATLRDNILFGSPMEKAWYWMVIQACALNEDLKVNGERKVFNIKIHTTLAQN